MKKQWISVKCGLSRDPKHRQAMGEGIWLFLHILDIASWDDGIAHDWKDEAAAEDMGMPVRTLREHRRKLSELGYITCQQKQYTQDIIIHNWTNPREYTGQTYNPKQGDSETEPEEKAQGYTQDYTQGNRKDVTPTYNSKNKESIKKKADKPPTPAEILVYRSVTSKYPNKAAYDEVVKAIQKVSSRLGRECSADDLLPYFKSWCTKSGNMYNFSVWLMEWAVAGTMQNKPAQKNDGDALDRYIAQMEAAQWQTG